MPSLNVTLNAILASLAAFIRSITQCGVSDEDDELVRQVIREGEDGISGMTIPMVVVTPPDADPALYIERAMRRANAPPSRIPIPNGGLTSVRRGRQILQQMSDGMERAVAEAVMPAPEEVEEAVAEVCEGLIAYQEEEANQRAIIVNTIAGIIQSMESMGDSLEGGEGEEGAGPSA